MGALDAVAGWPVGNAAVAVTDRERTLAATGGDEPYPWASVTKLITALAVLSSVDRGEVALDEPAGPPGATVRHLLAHASGVAPDGDAVLGPPGRRRIYSNRGIEIAAGLVADRTGTAFEKVSARPGADAARHGRHGAGRLPRARRPRAGERPGPAGP